VTVREATLVMEEGFKSVEQAFQKSVTSLDSVKDIARVLRKLPTVDPTIPTVTPMHSTPSHLRVSPKIKCRTTTWPSQQSSKFKLLKI